MAGLTPPQLSSVAPANSVAAEMHFSDAGAAKVKQITHTDHSRSGSGGKRQYHTGTKVAFHGAEHWDLHIPDLLVAPPPAAATRARKKSDAPFEMHGNVYRA